jgi:Smg protein
VKENVLDVLMYLFEYYMDDDNQFNHDQEFLKAKLMEAGFPRSNISKAFNWLEDLIEQQPSEEQAIPQKSLSMRVYSSEECARFNMECRGFLCYLEQMSILDTVSRELVIDRVMALESDEFDIEQLKWVILMVLFNQSDHKEAFTWMEDLVYEKMDGKLH